MLYVWQRFSTTIREPGRPMSSHTVRSPVSLSSTVLLSALSSVSVGALSTVFVDALPAVLVGAGGVCRLVERLVRRADWVSFSTAGEGSAFGFDGESAVEDNSRAVGTAESVVAISSAAGVEMPCARLAP